VQSPHPCLATLHAVLYQLTTYWRPLVRVWFGPAQATWMCASMQTHFKRCMFCWPVSETHYSILKRDDCVQIIKNLNLSGHGVWGQSIADAQMEGMAQLRSCIWTFDHTKCTAFSTFAWTQLHPRIRQALEGMDTAVHVPRRQLALQKKCASFPPGVQSTHMLVYP
jgi:hypothetical protein